MYDAAENQAGTARSDGRAAKSRTHLRPISCLCVLALSLWASMATAVTANECAILATEAGSDLAVDDPPRYEYLTQVCRNQRRAPSIAPRATPSTPVTQKQGKASPKAGGSSKPNALQRVDDSPAKGDKKESCPYKVYPVKDLKYPIGTKACLKGKLIVCKKNSKGEVAWDSELSWASCLDALDIETFERNMKEIESLNGKFKPYED